MPIRTFSLERMLKNEIPAELYVSGDVMKSSVEITETKGYPSNQNEAQFRIVIDVWVNPGENAKAEKECPKLGPVDPSTGKFI